MYLPQFHPISENDKWWGKGFTEWINVVKAKPIFRGHYQPHLPADLGFYDLRVPEVRIEQARMAKEYGIYGFCYYHYWFNGKRILERPFQEVFESGKPDFPFMLCWANENWTRVWDGGSDEILLNQEYTKEDARAHICTLIPYLKDKRYIRVGNKPIIAIYKSDLLPDPKGLINIWRDEALKEGLELYLCRMNSFGANGKEFLKPGFDAAIDFEPFSRIMSQFFQRYFKIIDTDQLLIDWSKKVLNKIHRIIFSKNLFEINHRYRYTYTLEHIKYDDYVNQYIKNYQQPDDYVEFPGICPSWDNTARRGKNAFLLQDSTPEAYKRWLKHIICNYKPDNNQENFIFFNAWNEWAEGNHLEPCQKWGDAYLKTTKEILFTY